MRRSCATCVACRQRTRQGFSLLEIVLSVAIFMLGFAGVMAALEIGRQAEVGARLQSEAVLRCEAVMGEILSGVQEVSSATGNRFDDDETGNWQWSANVSDAGTTSLLQVTVIVEHIPGGGAPNASFSLVRYMRDPQIFLDAALEGTE
ncbi:MAG: prepilin-type N-terminal cleavage/methylation domain-containing protein [Planctomycetota bacterium]